MVLVFVGNEDNVNIFCVVLARGIIAGVGQYPQIAFFNQKATMTKFSDFHEPERGIDPPSLLYESIALPLSYSG